MTSKKFKNKTCAYCGEASATADHVFARQFFLRHRRSNLPKVPACEKCNANKSSLEHYLATVLPFAGRHEDALEGIRTALPRRLLRNQTLGAEIQGSLAPAVEFDLFGTAWPTVAISIDAQRLENWARYLAQGLTYYHWNHPVSKNSAYRFLVPTAAECKMLDDLLRLKGRRSTAVDLGKGTVCYEGTELLPRGRASVWRFIIYGGVRIAGADASQRASALGVIVGPATATEE